MLADAEDAEHRPIATAFIEFRDTDAVLEREGPDVLAAAIDELIVAVQDAVHDHKVVFSETDISSNGGKILLIAGAPVSAGDDEERMLRTARAVIDQEFRLPIRIGVNCGRVFTGDFGPPYRRTYSCHGDALNTAARIMGKAQPGQALATEEVLARSRTKFELTPAGSFVLKGKAQPVAAYEIGPVIARETQARYELPLVGREEEMAALLEALASAREGRGRLVELIGEPGIGKSRLVEELRRHAGEIEMIVAVCEQYESSTPYQPFRRVFRSLLGLRENELPARVVQRLRRRVAETAPDLEPWLPLLGLLVDIELPETPEVSRLEDRFRRARLEEAAGELLARLLPEPTLLVFEDVHWIDEASADLLLHLAQQIGNRPWLLIPSRRDVDTGFVAPAIPEASALRPQPLDDRAALRLIESETEEEPLPPHVMATLAERAGGNPLFLAELVRAARSVGVDTLPDSVEALLAVQIDRLQPRVRRVLRYASVLGTSFPQDLLRASLEGHEHGLDDGVWDSLGNFIQRDRSGIASFRHALVRDAAYEGLPFKRRQELHRQVGAAIERLSGPDPETEAEVLSLHFFNAHEFDKAWRYSKAAGDRARSAYAPAEARDFFRRALAAGRLLDVPGTELAAVQEAIGDASHRLGAAAEAMNAYRAARRHLGDDSLNAARLLLAEAKMLTDLGRSSQSLRSLSRGLKVLAGSSGPEAEAMRARLLIWYASTRAYQGRYREALPLCVEAMAAAERLGDLAAVAQGSMIRDIISLEGGIGDDDSYGKRALALYEKLGDLPLQAHALVNIGVRAYWSGDWSGAVRLFEQARELFRTIGDTFGLAESTYNIGEILSDQGRLEEAEARLREASRLFRSTESDRPPIATSELGRILYRSGRYEDGLAMLEEAKREFVSIGADSGWAREVDVRIAECWMLMGDGERAAEHVDAAIAEVQRKGPAMAVRIPRLLRIRGCALLIQGDHEEARVSLEQSIEGSRRDGEPYELALALHGLEHVERVTGSDKTDELTQERLDILNRLGIEAAPGLPDILKVVARGT